MSDIPLPDVEKDPSIGISFSIQMGQTGRSLVMQTFVARDGDVKQLNDALDKMRAAADRQVAVLALEKVKLDLSQAEQMAITQAARIEQVDKNIAAAWARGSKRGDPVLTAKERTEQQQAYANAEALKGIIAKHKQDIAAFEAIIGA
jgi:hypothetical protein